MATRAAVGRPSRRQSVIRAAMELFATGTPAEVAVADIADRANMTTAALYYHFKSKDQILLEGFTTFGARLVERVNSETAGLTDGFGALVARLLTWLDECDPDATVYFVSSVASSHDVEVARRAVRHTIIDALGPALRRLDPTMSAPRSLIIGASILGVFETAAASWIERDETYRGLGRRGFLAEVEDIVDRLPLSAP